MRFVPLLSIEAAPGVLRYRLDVPERDFGEPLQEEFRHPLEESTLQALQESAEALLRSAENPRFPDEARTRGGVLYRSLVPARLRTQLATLRGPLLISTTLYGLPWELLHDGDEFWGLRYALGKRLVMARPLPTATGSEGRGRPRALVIGSDPRGDLPFVRHEVEAICETLEPFADVDCVRDRLATFDAVTRSLGRAFDLIHYCGHVVAGADVSPALLLADQKMLPASAIEANLTGRPLVFLNGCASARGAGAGAAGSWEPTLSGVAYAFLFGGAMGVVGTLSPVSDRHAAVLAEEFYRRALAGTRVGEALRVARQHCRTDPGSAGSPTWLSFVLYGNPAQELLPAQIPREPSRPAAAEVPAAAVPAAAAPRPLAQRLARFAAFAILLAGLVAGFLQVRRPAAPVPLVVGVMEVRGRGPGVPAWMREITRDGLNTILSKFTPIRVFSRQKIDFVREKRGLSEIEAAEALGMTKMLSATVAVDDALVTLDLDVVDTASGLLEASEHLQGPREQFMQLQTELALRTLRVLGVTPSEEQVRAILASRGNETLELYRMLRETLGEPAPAPPAPAPSDSEQKAPGTSWLGWGGVAYAQDGEEAAIRALLDRYAAALQAKDVEQLAALQMEMSPAQRAALARYFANATHLEVRISDVDVLIEGDEALATFTRTDAFVDAGSRRQMHLEVRISGVLTKTDGTWRIRGLRDPS